MARQRTYDDTLRDRLIDEAAQVIADHGVQALSVRDVAMRAGTTTNAIYTFFGSRGSLVAEVVAKADESFVEAHRVAAGEGADLLDLYAIGKAYVMWAVEYPTMYVILTDRAGARLDPPPWAPHIEHGASEDGAPIVRTVSRLMAEGVLTAADPVLVSTYLWAGVHGYVEVNRLLDGQVPDGYDLVEYLHALIAPWVATDADGKPVVDLDEIGRGV
ncbi:TetR/AcrR family transcriptional regulator [Georgenia sp. Z1344]|uniref:TetR/AcrR family transcriptional regulator n=1 Tax=Georgenia sp. Z1344 TaxID=3416706 RepID=UPI003CF9188A